MTTKTPLDAERGEGILTTSVSNFKMAPASGRSPGQQPRVQKLADMQWPGRDLKLAHCSPLSIASRRIPLPAAARLALRSALAPPAPVCSSAFRNSSRISSHSLRVFAGGWRFGMNSLTDSRVAPMHSHNWGYLGWRKNRPQGGNGMHTSG